MTEKKNAAYRLGVIVLAGLAILTLVEYFVALLPNVTVWLFIIGLFKAGVILHYFMHMSHLWSEEDH